MKTSLLLLLLVACLCAYAQTPQLNFTFNEANGTATATEAVSNVSYPVRNNFDKPERVPGISGNALRTDGWSTWVDAGWNYNFGATFTFETWVILESYPSDQESSYPNLTPSAILSKYDGTNGYQLAMNTYGVWSFTININGVKQTVTAPTFFPLYQWTHVAAVADANAGSLRLYLNGKQIAMTSFAPGGEVIESANPLVIGKNNIDKSNGFFLYNAMNAAIDETRLYNIALTQAQVHDRYNTGAAVAASLGYKSVDVPLSRWDGDLKRPIFHGLPPANWTNEPHGLVKTGNKYHMFYQRTPNGTYKEFMNWGHMSSNDLVNWSYEKDALRPSVNSPTDQLGTDMKGIWSGDVIMNDTTAYAFYTSVNWVGEYDPGISIATSTDANLINWSKQGPVLDKGPAQDMRDPFVFKVGTTWYMIIGAKWSTGGGLLYYSSTNLVNWTYMGDFASISYDAMDKPGSEIWEMPVFEEIGGGKWILICSPIGADPTTGIASPPRGVYWTGTFSGEKFNPDFATPKHVDMFVGHLSPTTERDYNNQIVGIGIVDEKIDPTLQKALGWCHLYSLPRVYSLVNNGQTLAQKPLPDLTKIRNSGSAISFTDLTVTENNLTLSGATGRQAEIIVQITPGTVTGKYYGVNVGVSPNRDEFISIKYDVDRNEIVLDKRFQNVPENFDKVEYRAPYDLASFGKPNKFHVFIDGSVIDVFINDGAAFSSRIYTNNPAATNIEVFSFAGTTTFSDVQFWNINRSVPMAVASVPVTGIILDKTSMSIENGFTGKLNASVTPSAASNTLIMWTSSNTAVATVDSNGLVRAVAQGSAIITARSQEGDFSKNCSVTVTASNTSWKIYDFENQSFNDLIISGSAFSQGDITSVSSFWGSIPFAQQGAWHCWGFKEGEDVQTGEMKTPDFTLGGDGQINFLIAGGRDINNLFVGLYKSDNTLVGKVTAFESEAYTRISIDGFSAVGASCYLKVVDNATGGWGHINVDDIRIPTRSSVAVTGVDIVQNSINVNVEQTSALTVNVSPSDATNKNVTFTSSNTSVATVNASGVVTGVAAGTSTITVRTEDGGFTDNCSVTVTVPVTSVDIVESNVDLYVGQTSQLTANISPTNASNTTVTWTSSNSSVATVSASGVVTAVASGTTTITVTTQDGGFTDNCSVSITTAPYTWKIYNFENQSFDDMIISGAAFSQGDITTDTGWGWGGPFNQQGSWHCWGFKAGGDAETGELRTPDFTLGGDGVVNLLIGGGNDINNLYVGLFRSDNSLVGRVTGANAENYIRVTIDGGVAVGTTCYLKVVDMSTGGWGHVNIDDIQIPVMTSNGIISGATYRISSRETGKSLDVYGGTDATDDGVNIFTYDYLGATNQQWIVTDIGGGYYKVIAKHSGKAMEVAGGPTATGNQANVQQWTYLAASNQQWSITDIGGGYYKVIAKHSGKCLDVDVASANAQQWEYLGGNNQQWQFMKIADPARVAGKEETEVPSMVDKILTVYPVPVEDHFTVDLTLFTGDQNVTVQITDVSGKRVEQMKATSPLLVFSAKALRMRPGLYLMNAQSEKRRYFVKIIVK